MNRSQILAFAAAALGGIVVSLVMPRPALAGTGALSLTLSTTVMAFADQAAASTSPPKTLTLTNGGSSAIMLTSIAVTGAEADDFLLSSGCGPSLAAGTSCSVSVLFTPVSAGAKRAVLTLFDSAARSPQQVALSGEGTAPSIVTLSTAALQFANQVATTGSAPQVVTLSNRGSATLALSPIVVAGAQADDFVASTGCGSSLAAGATCSVSVIFKPVSAGFKSGSLQVTVESAPPQTVALSGHGLAAPVLMLSTQALTFANQPVPTISSPKTFTVTNSGVATAALFSIQVTGAEADDFVESSSCGFFLAPGATCSISISFRPVSPGKKTGVLAIADDAANTLQQVALRGEGLPEGPPSFQVAAPTVTVTAAPTDAAPAPAIGLTVNNPPSGGVYTSYTLTGPAVIGVDIQWNAAPVNGILTGSAELTFDLPELQGSGTYTSTLTIEACLDALCKTQLPGSPQTITVTYIVTGNAIPAGTFSLLPTSLNIETPSNGATAPASVDLGADELPPYGAYVSYKTQSTAVVQSMSFSGFVTGKLSGNGILTVNFTPPATLGPGVYKDTITLSVCYDRACTKPAVGSPWLIPVVYTVTASVGREFQQRIVPLSAYGLAVDPLGKKLYIADYEYSGASQSNLVQIDPVTGETLASVALPGVPMPNQVSTSADGKYVYVVVFYELVNKLEIDRIDVATMTLDQKIPFTESDVAIGEVAVSPVNSSTIAVSYGYLGQTTGPFSNFQIMDNGIVRRNIYSIVEQTYGSTIQWSIDGSRLFIRDSSNLIEATVDAQGIENPSQLISLVSEDGFFGSRFHNVNDILYSDGGGVFDPASKSVLGLFSLATPSSTGANSGSGLVPDPATRRAFATYVDPGYAALLYTLQSFDLDTFAPIWIARFPVQISSPVRWGANGLAFIGLNPDPTNGEFSVYLIDGTFVAP